MNKKLIIFVCLLYLTCSNAELDNFVSVNMDIILSIFSPDIQYFVLFSSVASPHIHDLDVSIRTPTTVQNEMKTRNPVIPV